MPTATIPVAKDRSEIDRLVAEYLAKGGTIKICPPFKRTPKGKIRLKNKSYLERLEDSIEYQSYLNSGHPALEAPEESYDHPLYGYNFDDGDTVDEMGQLLHQRFGDPAPRDDE